MAILIAGKRGGSGLTGLAPGAKILPLAAEDIAFDGIINAIRFAADHNARVINISQSASALDEERVALQKAIDYANRKGSLIFAGTGNHGDDHNIPTSPADLPGVIGVGAIDESLNVADFSVYGPQVALTAPGVNILSRCDGPGYCVKQGTSDSTAIASASAALIWAKHPDWTNNQVLRVMMETAVKPNDGVVPSECLGYGIVRPRKVLLDNEGDPGPPDVNPLFPDYPPVQNSPSPTAPKDGAEPTPAPEDSDSPEPSDRANDGNADHISPWLIGAGGAVLALTATGAGYKLIRRQREPR